MKIKVGDTVYDSSLTPVMVILTDGDKRNIANMLPECNKYASFPEDIEQGEIERWMNDVPKEESQTSLGKKYAT